MLSYLQRRIATILAGLDEAEDFVMAGGGALIAHGVVDRPTRDLDFFSTEPVKVDDLLPVLEQALLEDGLEVTREQTASGFARLVVSDESASCQTRVDLAADARVLPPESSEYGYCSTLRNSPLTRVLAIFGVGAADRVFRAVLSSRSGSRIGGRPQL